MKKILVTLLLTIPAGALAQSSKPNLTFMTGMVKDTTVCSGTPSVCRYSVLFETMDGKTLEITDPKAAKDLRGLDGAVVRLLGTRVQTTYVLKPGADIEVRGYLLTLRNGSKLLIPDDNSPWLSGTFGTEKIYGDPMFITAAAREAKGSNVSRGAMTAVPAGTARADSAATAQGAGIPR